MKLSTFLSHQWLSFWRARNANKSLALQIILGLFYLFIFLEVAALGIVLPFVIGEYLPGKNPVDVFTSYIVYYFLIGLIIRFQIQELPSLSIQPYLAQNISRKKMLQFLNARSLIHIFNFLPLFVFIPFTVVIIAADYGSLAAWLFVLAMLALVINNHFLTMYLKRKSTSNSWWFLSIVLLIAGLKAMEYFKWFSFEQSSATFFTWLLHHPFYFLFFIVLAVVTFYWHNAYLKSHLYIEELVSEKKLKAGNNFAFLNRFGDTGDIIALDLKLIFRNKRPKTLVILSGVILSYGFMFYPQYLRSENYSMIFFFALLITGLFISNYGQFLFSWQSSHFDGMMSYNINMHQYIRAKFALFITVSTIQFLVASLYGLMSWKILLIQTAAYLWGIGVNTFVTIYAATYNYRYLNLSRSANMNFQGIGGLQWLQSLSISFGPVLIFYVVNRFVGLQAAALVISMIGLVGLVASNKIINVLVKEFNARKHKILAGFRER